MKVLSRFDLSIGFLP